MHQQKYDELKKILEVLDTFRRPLNVLHDELRDEYDDLDEKEQEEEDGEALNANVECLSQACTALDECIEQLEGVTGPE